MLNSYDFQHNIKYQELLSFLVKASLDDRLINEKLLAIEIFNKDESFDPAVDSSVRTYMSNLRKKIEHYNLTEGKNNRIMLTLPKGGYHVEFTRQKSPITSRILSYLNLPQTIYLPVIIILLLSSIFLLTERVIKSDVEHIIPEDNPIWHNLFDTEKKLLIILGDYYFFRMPLDSGQYLYARNIFINSKNDLDAYLEEHPGLKQDISTIYHTYLDEHIPLCVSFIMSVLVTPQHEIELKLSSEIRLEDLQNYNIIYIGSYKTLYLLKAVIANLSFNLEFRPEESVISFFSRETGITHTYSFVTNPDTRARNDYAMFIKVSGHNNNTFYLFLSQHDFGNLATVKYFTNPERLAEFSNRVNSEYFEALFEVTGILRTDFDINLLHVNELYSNFEIKLD
jgi:hypothetical protein